MKRVDKLIRLAITGPFLILIVLITSSAIPYTASADSSICSGGISPTDVTTNSDNIFGVEVDNTGSNPINWVEVDLPSAYLTVESAHADGWTVSSDNSRVTFSAGNIDSGNGINFSIEAVSGTSATPGPQPWQVSASSDPGGTGAATCDGSYSTSVTVPPSVINISNLATSNISSNSITISWDTDIPSTTKLMYGTDVDYGSPSIQDSNLVTNHSVTLKGLQANTSYHYEVESSTPADGGDSVSGDNTFLTAVKEQSPSTSSNQPSIGVKITNPGDKIPPTISFNSQIPRVVKSIFDISGTASDETAVTKVEYSLDSGKNWLPTEQAQGLGTKKATFTIKPANLDDGNYELLARAIDGGGNMTVTKAADIVFDQLPPETGGLVLSIGPQVLQPDQSDNIQALAGVDERITMSAIGGPTSITLVADRGKKNPSSSFSLTQSPDSGLWSGIMSFSDPGTYEVSAQAIDGAGNHTQRTIGKVTVSQPSRIIDKNSKPVSAKVTVYKFIDDTNDWQAWDGSAYGQDNPQITDKDGYFSLFLPAGKYYVKSSAKGYATATSSIIDFDQPQPLSVNMTLSKSESLFSRYKVQKVTNQKQPALANANTLVGKPAPGFSLTDISGKKVNGLDLSGKPTDLIFLNSWAPAASEQLPAAQSLSGDKNLNVKIIALQENSGRLNAYNQISGYDIDWLADPLSTTSNTYDVGSLPSHYFLDRGGNIKKVVSAVLTKQQILDNLSNL